MYRILFILFFLSVTPQVIAESSVWLVEKGANKVYLGGTIHLLRATDYPLPVEFEKAYHQSQLVTFETNIKQLNNPDISRQMLFKMSYQDKRTIQSETSPEVYQQLNNYAKSAGISLKFMRKAKPGMLMSAFMLNELGKIGVNQEGIDMYFLNKALDDNKKTLFLETPVQQIDFLAEIGIGNEDRFYQSLMRDIEQTQTLFSKMVKYWRSGNNVMLDAATNQMMKADSPQTFETLIVQRNLNWLPTIEQYFETPEIELILVGAAHLIGEQGLLNKLAAKGYKVSKLQVY